MKTCSHAVRFDVTPDGRICYRGCKNKVTHTLEARWYDGTITYTGLCSQHIGGYRPNWQTVRRINNGRMSSMS